VAALTCLLQTPPSFKEAIAHLKTYDSVTQELFIGALPILADLSLKGVDKMKPEEIALLQQQVQGLLQTLRARSKLVIGKMCFVEGIDGPGAYKPLPETHPFLAPCLDRPGEQVFVYVELYNVGSIHVDGCYETRLSSVVEIRRKGEPNSKRPDYTYNLVSQRRPLRSPESCSECFRGYTFYVPDIPPGEYQLTLVIKDETTPREPARQSLDFMVVPGNVAAN
jgi:hypothetical protein